MCCTFKFQIFILAAFAFLKNHTIVTKIQHIVYTIYIYILPGNKTRLKNYLQRYHCRSNRYRSAFDAHWRSHLVRTCFSCWPQNSLLAIYIFFLSDIIPVRSNFGLTYNTLGVCVSWADHVMIPTGPVTIRRNISHDADIRVGILYEVYRVIFFNCFFF